LREKADQKLKRGKESSYRIFMQGRGTDEIRKKKEIMSYNKIFKVRIKINYEIFIDGGRKRGQPDNRGK
jgi:hypothetical protein